MSDPTPFRVVDPGPSHGVVEMARKLLEHAEAGRITSLVFVAHIPGGDVMRGHVLTPSTSVMAMIGAASVLHQRLLQEVEWPDG